MCLLPVSPPVIYLFSDRIWHLLTKYFSSHPTPSRRHGLSLWYQVMDKAKGGLHGRGGPTLGFSFIWNDCLFIRPVCVSSVTSFRTLSSLLFFSTPDSLNSLLAATEWAIWSYGNSKEKLVSHPKIAPCNSSLTNMRVYLSGQLHAERRVFIYLFFQSDY
jgi:hypothetical protein